MKLESVYFVEFTSRKFLTDEALIPKLIPSVLSFAKPDTATATNSPFSFTMGPPLLPGLIAASIWISFELSLYPFKELIIP